MELKEDRRALNKHFWFSPAICENILVWWNRLSEFDNEFFVKTDGSSYEHFKQVLLFHSEMILEFDYGIVRVSDLVTGFWAKIHAMFWDQRKTIEHKEELKESIEYFMSMMKLKRLEIEVPKEAYGLRRFASRLGFEKEGVRRLGYRLVDNSLIDTVIYSRIEEEERHGK